jgi:NADH:ubiquinone oxidoreductase subunit F (NADH-binding)
VSEERVIIPPEARKLGGRLLEVLHAEMQSHMHQCQEHYQKALARQDAGAVGEQAEFNLAIMEGLGALMCGQEHLTAMFAALLQAMVERVPERAAEGSQVS